MTDRVGRRVVQAPTGTVTFLFTDIEGSTALWENHPDRMQAALARHDEILGSAVEASGGLVFKTVGDAFCAAFATPRQAVEATLAAQRALFAEPWDSGCAIRVRMALHTGVAEERGGDYFGPPVNRVARLLSTGHGGQVLLSSVAYGLVRDVLGHIEEGSELRDLGEHRLKGLKHTERIWQLVVPDLPAEFPPLETLGLVGEHQTASGTVGDTTSEDRGEERDDPTPGLEEEREKARRAASLEERYRRIRPIGGGGMAEVWLARDEVLERDVALKMLRTQYTDDEQFVGRFMREARNVASLSHHNIVAVHDRGRSSDGRYYIVMEYLSGGTLKDLIEEEGAVPPERAASIAAQVARALQAAHRREIVHRDIKPQNVLLGEAGEAKVADFGIAHAAAMTRVTQEGSVLGSAQYLSPEQAMGRQVSPRSDLYSLGVVLFEMLTGAVPFESDTPVGLVMSHVNTPPRPPKEINPQVPDELNAITERLLAKNPDDRYPDAGALADDLEAFLQGTHGGPPRRVRVPDLTGQSLSEAGGVLTRAGLALGASHKVRSAATPQGAVADQDPRPGAEIEPGTAVRVAVSKGERGTPRWALAAAAAGLVLVLLLVGGAVLAWSLLGGEETVEVPSLEGQTLAAARETAGEEFKISSQGGRERGVVQSQDPEPGTEARAGDSIEVVLGPEIVAVPDVTGRSRQEAEELLRSEGFEARAVPREGPEEDVGRVLEQNPAGEAEKGSTVEIAIGEAPPPEQAQQPEEEAPTSQGPAEPAPGYTLVTDATGSLSVEVPDGWRGVITSEDGTFDGQAEAQGEGAGPSITATTDISVWEGSGGVPGTYVVASRELAQQYTDDQLVSSGFNDRSATCTAGAVEDFDRAPYSGKVQSWSCEDGGEFTTLAAATEGRECVVMLQVAAYSEADGEAVRHILDTFEADCGEIAVAADGRGTEISTSAALAPPG